MTCPRPHLPPPPPLLSLSQVDDANFKKLVAIIRIAVPYTGMILSTRESAEMRDELLKVDVGWLGGCRLGGGGVRVLGLGSACVRGCVGV